MILFFFLGGVEFFQSVFKINLWMGYRVVCGVKHLAGKKTMVGAHLSLHVPNTYRVLAPLRGAHGQDEKFFTFATIPDCKMHTGVVGGLGEISRRN